MIEIVAGAGGNIGTERVAKATLDGYTLALVRNAPEQLNTIIRNDIPKWAKVIKDSGAKLDWSLAAGSAPRATPPCRSSIAFFRRARHRSGARNAGGHRRRP